MREREHLHVDARGVHRRQPPLADVVELHLDVVADVRAAIRKHRARLSLGELALERRAEMLFERDYSHVDALLNPA